MSDVLFPACSAVPKWLKNEVKSIFKAFKTYRFIIYRQALQLWGGQRSKHTVQYKTTANYSLRKLKWKWVLKLCALKLPNIKGFTNVRFTQELYWTTLNRTGGLHKLITDMRLSRFFETLPQKCKTMSDIKKDQRVSCSSLFTTVVTQLTCSVLPLPCTNRCRDICPIFRKVLKAAQTSRKNIKKHTIYLQSYPAKGWERGEEEEEEEGRQLSRT